MKKVNSYSPITTMTIGASIGAIAGLEATLAAKEYSKNLLKQGGFDSFEKATEFAKKYVTIKENGKLVTDLKHLKKAELTELLEIRSTKLGKYTTEELLKLANKAFKTASKTFAKNAAIFGGIGLAVASIVTLIKKSKNNHEMKPESEVTLHDILKEAPTVKFDDIDEFANS